MNKFKNKCTQFHIQIPPRLKQFLLVNLFMMSEKEKEKYFSKEKKDDDTGIQIKL
jgi:hypothetical protein